MSDTKDNTKQTEEEVLSEEETTQDTAQSDASAEDAGSDVPSKEEEEDTTESDKDATDEEESTDSDSDDEDDSDDSDSDDEDDSDDSDSDSDSDSEDDDENDDDDSDSEDKEDDDSDDKDDDDDDDSDKDASDKKKDSDDDDSDDDEEEPGSWYVVHTQSGFEAKSKDSLEQRIVSLGLTDKIFEIIVPMRDIVTINKGKKRQKKEKVFPGYILVRMILDNDTWIAVRTTQGITGFVGAGTKPTPITEKEVQAIMKFVKQDQPKFKAQFSVGEAVRVTDGPFNELIGTINQIDEDKGKVTVLVSIFGRETPVELDFLQVNKL